jgi:hypothetical protein
VIPNYLASYLTDPSLDLLEVVQQGVEDAPCLVRVKLRDRVRLRLRLRLRLVMQQGGGDAPCLL